MAIRVSGGNRDFFFFHFLFINPKRTARACVR
jgi:hypothetical protein